MNMMGEGEGGQEGGFLWENESWAFSNSDNSGTAGSGENSEDGKKENKKNKKKKNQEDETRNSNSPNPPPTAAAPPSSAAGKIRNINKRKGILLSSSSNQGNYEQGKGGTTESDHEMHIWTERERRKKMRSMFSSLHALLPQLPPKADKSTIVDEAVNYIKTLEQTLQKLEKQKLERIHGVNSISAFDSQKVGMESREAFLADQGSSSHHHQTNSISNLSRQHPAVFRTWVSPNVILNICGDNAHINVCCPKRLGLFTAITFFLEKNKLEVVSAQVSSDHYKSMFMIQVQVINGAIDHFLQSFSSVEEIFQQAAGEIMSYISSL